MRSITLVFIAVVMLSLAACAASSQASRTPLSSPDTAAQTAHPQWVETRLYFGIGPVDAPLDAAAARWRDFLDEVVTPRFPQGFSAIDAYGQWMEPGEARPERLHSKLLLIVHEDTPAMRARIEQIREAWKQRTGDHSVLRVSGPVDISF